MTIEPYNYVTQSEKRRDFIIGVAIFVVLNLLLGILSILPTWLAQIFPQANEIFVYLLIAFYCLPWIVNGVAILYFLVKRRWIAFGMLAAFGVILLCALLAGLIFAGICFYMTTQGQ